MDISKVSRVAGFTKEKKKYQEIKHIKAKSKTAAADKLAPWVCIIGKTQCCSLTWKAFSLSVFVSNTRKVAKYKYSPGCVKLRKKDRKNNDNASWQTCQYHNCTVKRWANHSDYSCYSGLIPVV